MRTVTYSEIGPAAWDDFCMHADDACFYHTTTSMDFTLHMHPRRTAENLSFGITENGQLIAISPLIKEEIYEEPGKHQFGFSGSYEPFPAFVNNVGEAWRHRLLKEIFTEIDRLAEVHGVAYASFAIPALIPPMLEGRWRVNPLPQFGFNDTQIATRVVDLTDADGRLLVHCRKGHKSDIKFALKSGASVVVFDAETITRDAFDLYRDIHYRAAGRQTRPDQTWEIMYQWIRNGLSVLALCWNQHKDCIAAALSQVYKDRGFYGSAGVVPEFKDERGAMHLIIWETMKHLQQKGVRWYETGLQYTRTLSQEVASPKEINIALFKRGFGGFDIPQYRGEKFYQSDFAEKVLARRLQQLKRLHAPGVPSFRS